MPGPETSFAKAGDVSIAYQVVGQGDVDVVLVPQWLSNIEQYWDHPAAAYFLRRIASFSRLILFDKRGTGLSDPAPTTQTLEERMDDVTVGMDAVGSERAVLLGATEGGPLDPGVGLGLLAGRPLPHAGSGRAVQAMVGPLRASLGEPGHGASDLRDDQCDRRARHLVLDPRAGDGVFAAFDGPARAVRCAMSIVEALRTLDVELRAGLHTGECQLSGDDLAGVTVHIGARIADLAQPQEVLVSGTVRDLVVGSNLGFRFHGVRPLQGVPGEWRLFTVDQGA